MKKFLVFCAALYAVLPVFAAPVDFRSGKILRVESSTSRPSGFRRLAVDEAPRDPVYIAVTVKLDRGRKISIFDYSLKLGGKTYECAAVRDNGENEILIASDGGKKRRCTLFFEIDAAAVERGGSRLLVCNAPGGGEVELKIVDRGGRRFSRDSEIPDPETPTAEK